MMKTSVNVKIMENEFQLVCEENERDNILKSATYLSKQIRDFQRANPNLDVERLLIMGALGATCELMSELDIISTQARVTNGEVNKLLKTL